MKLRFSVLIVAMFALAIPLSAQPLADRVPADALVYFGWCGADSMPAAYEQSHLKAVLDQSRLRDLLTQTLPMALAKAGGRGPAPAWVPAVRSMLDQVVKHPTAGWFAGLDLTNPRDPMPRLGIICKAGPDAAALSRQIAMLLGGAPRNAPFHTALVDDMVVFVVGYPDVPGALAAANKSLKQAPGFTSAMKQVGADPALVVYGDVEKGLAHLLEVVNAAPDQQARVMVPKIIDALGINGVKRFILTAGFDGKDFSEQVFVEAPSPRTGLLAMVDGAPVTAQLLKAIPADATFVATTRFDPALLISTLRESAAKIDPQALQVVDRVLGAVQLAIAKNPVTDVFEPLGKDWAMYCSPSVAGNGVLGMVLINKLDDPAKARSSLPTAWINLSNWAAVAMTRARAGVEITGRTTEIDGMNIYYAGLPAVAPAWTIKDELLYAGLYPQSVVSAARSSARHPTSITDNERFKALQQRLGVSSPCSISFYDLQTTATTGGTYDKLLALVRAGGFADLFGVPMPEPLLPPLDVLYEHLGPAGSATWVDDAGVHCKSISPFPGAKLLSEPAMLTTVAPLAATLFAGVAVPRVAVRRNVGPAQAHVVQGVGQINVCAANLRQLGVAASLYGNINQGQFPPDLADLVRHLETMGAPRAASLLCPDRPRGKPDGLASMTVDAYVAWVSKTSDYEYVGGGVTTKSHPQTIVMYEKQPQHAGTCNVLFADGHVQPMPPQAIAALVRQQAQRPPQP